MKITDASFQSAVKLGAILLVVSAVANIYLLLRYREIYRDASRIEVAAQKQTAVLVLRTQVLESLIREFVSRSANDPGISGIFQRYQSTNAVTTGAQP